LDLQFSGASHFTDGMKPDDCQLFGRIGATKAPETYAGAFTHVQQ
jgi:hypothetical protein